MDLAVIDDDGESRHPDAELRRFHPGEGVLVEDLVGRGADDAGGSDVAACGVSVRLAPR